MCYRWVQLLIRDLLNIIGTRVASTLIGETTMNDLEAWLAFRRGENPPDIKLVCCDCGKQAEGNVTCDDGEICDACDEKSMMIDGETGQ